jgi:hypothetical protein
MNGSLTLATVPAPLAIPGIVIDSDDLDVCMHASLSRVMATAPIERKLAVFRLMAVVARMSIAERRQQAVDDLWTIAEESGLVDLLGANWVQRALASGFEGE